jgi:hypothetical protein
MIAERYRAALALTHHLKPSGTIDPRLSRRRTEGSSRLSRGPPTRMLLAQALRKPAATCAVRACRTERSSFVANSIVKSAGSGP